MEWKLQCLKCAFLNPNVSTASPSCQGLNYRGKNVFIMRLGGIIVIKQGWHGSFSKNAPVKSDVVCQRWGIKYSVTVTGATFKKYFAINASWNFTGRNVVLCHYQELEHLLVQTNCRASWSLSGRRGNREFSHNPWDHVPWAEFLVVSICFHVKDLEDQ